LRVKYKLIDKEIPYQLQLVRGSLLVLNPIPQSGNQVSLTVDIIKIIIPRKSTLCQHLRDILLFVMNLT